MTLTPPFVSDGAGHYELADPVILVDADGNAITVNGSVGALVTVDAIHRQIHIGRLFEAGHYATGIANAGTVDILIVTAINSPHVRFQIGASGAATAQLYEDVSASANGTAVSSFNRNRNSANTVTTTLFHTPTITNTGTALMLEYLPGGEASGNRTVGSTLPTFEEWILKPATKYLVRITNVSGSAISAAANFAFYEIDAA